MSVGILDQDADHRLPRQKRGWITYSELLLFGVFAVYGPSFTLGGQFRYVEALILAWGLIHLSHLGRNLERIEWWLLSLLLVSSFAHVFSGVLNGSPGSAIIARSGTYIVLVALIVILAQVTNFEPRKILAMLLGYCVSYVFILFSGQSFSERYNELPWQLGLGAAVTLAIAAIFAIRPKLLLISGPALAALGAVHLWQGGRSMAGIVLMASIAMILIVISGKDVPARTRLFKSIIGVLALACAVWLGIVIIAELAFNGFLPAKLTKKVMLQYSHSYGMLAAARPDTLTALYAITFKPLLGYGPGVIDPDIYAFYSRVVAETYAKPGNLMYLTEYFNRRDWTLGIPSHSHIFGAWADAGVVAIVPWLATLSLSVYVFVAAARWHNAWTPLYLIVSLSIFWDVLFSPGPHRIDLAIKVIILFAAVRHIRWVQRQVGEIGQ